MVVVPSSMSLGGSTICLDEVGGQSVPVIKVNFDIKIPVASLLSTASDFQGEWAGCRSTPSFDRQQGMVASRQVADAQFNGASVSSPPFPSTVTDIARMTTTSISSMPQSPFLCPVSPGQGKGEIPMPFTRLQAPEAWEPLPHVSATAPSSPPAPTFGKSRAGNKTQGTRLALSTACDDVNGASYAATYMEPMSSLIVPWVPRHNAETDGTHGRGYPSVRACTGQSIGAEPSSTGLMAALCAPPPHNPAAPAELQDGPLADPPFSPFGADITVTRVSF